MSPRATPVEIRRVAQATMQIVLSMPSDWRALVDEYGLNRVLAKKSDGISAPQAAIKLALDRQEIETARLHV